jgi:hypothetical protein
MRDRRPQRVLHLIDIENLVGEPRPSRSAVHETKAAYEEHVLVGEHDLTVVACNHGAAIAVGLAYPGCRLVLRSGRDGADLALIDVLDHENVSSRFDAVALGSGDGIFSAAIAALAQSGVTSIVVARPEALSRRLRLAAGGRVIHFQMAGHPEEPADAILVAAA